MWGPTSDTREHKHWIFGYHCKDERNEIYIDISSSITDMMAHEQRFRAPSSENGIDHPRDKCQWHWSGFNHRILLPVGRPLHFHVHASMKKGALMLHFQCLLQTPRYAIKFIHIVIVTHKPRSLVVSECVGSSTRKILLASRTMFLGLGCFASHEEPSMG